MDTRDKTEKAQDQDTQSILDVLNDGLNPDWDGMCPVVDQGWPWWELPRKDTEGTEKV